MCFVCAAFYAALRSQSVMLVLGASASRPREAYELRLAVARDGAEQRTVGRDAGADAARRATRVLVGALADAPEAHSGALRTCMLRRLCAHLRFAPGSKLFVLLRTSADAAVPPGFLPKRNLRPALHRCARHRVACGARLIVCFCTPQSQGGAHRAHRAAGRASRHADAAAARAAASRRSRRRHMVRRNSLLSKAVLTVRACAGCSARLWFAACRARAARRKTAER